MCVIIDDYGIKGDLKSLFETLNLQGDKVIVEHRTDKKYAVCRASSVVARKKILEETRNINQVQIARRIRKGDLHWNWKPRKSSNCTISGILFETASGQGTFSFCEAKAEQRKKVTGKIPIKKLKNSLVTRAR